MTGTATWLIVHMVHRGRVLSFSSAGPSAGVPITATHEPPGVPLALSTGRGLKQ